MAQPCTLPSQLRREPRPGRHGPCWPDFGLLLAGTLLVCSGAWSQSGDPGDWSGRDAQQAIEPEPFSPYESAARDTLLARGLASQEQGDHEAAAVYLNRAWQTNRIEFGLFDESQVDLLEALIRSERALRDWHAVDDHYAYLELLYRRLYGIDDPRLELGLQKVSGWLNSALRINFADRRMEHLTRANRIYKLRLQIAERTLAAGDPKFSYLQENIAFCEKQLYRLSDVRRERDASERRWQPRYRERLIAGRE